MSSSINYKDLEFLVSANYKWNLYCPRCGKFFIDNKYKSNNANIYLCKTCANEKTDENLNNWFILDGLFQSSHKELS